MSGEIDFISERTNIFYMCTYESLVIGCKMLEIIFITDYLAHGMLVQMLYVNFLYMS